ncbi:DUF452 family protein [Epibacterium ulvae]|uniref:pimeloyl-ACP methyl esterase BioG family protein n=1 Tax=Epibacterium ulvae TaxID=1156985 RepID=UPI001BFCBD6A|nr:pimeloyl-ACP methyl esterase BioG family protein [Epibacterium ulvae]MBT8153763.1 DUF452 family protein [Epibacterium ulvae]
MNGRWLHQSGQEEAMVVFGGWAVGSAPFDALPKDRDVYFLDDYRDLDADLPDLSVYSSVDLVAWSFGVAAFGHWQAENPTAFRHRVALCGSLNPVDRRQGIPPLAYRRTIDGLTQASYQQFQTRVFGQEQGEAEIDVAARRAELQAVEGRGAAPDTVFDTVWIAQNDAIFPLQNMQRAWAGQEPRVVDAPHAPFEKISRWDAFWS